MVTVSAVVKKLVAEKPLFQEGLRQGIVNYAALAENIMPNVRQHLGKEVKTAAVIMALRRHGESLHEKDVREVRLSPHAQLILKTGLAYLSMKRTPQLFRRLENLHRTVNYEAGDTFNVIHGNHEVSIIADDKNEKKAIAAIGQENVTTTERSLVSVSMALEKDFLYTPGILFAVTRKLYWDNINIFEMVTTATELTLIFQKKDAMRAYASMQELIEDNA
ncbi:hypothetical protein HYU18_03415 [Candidatus Woesearchaeota archaeon]|nr:hypothetical protein [Candidatus Woesearchaeota archaeon]